MKPDKSKSPFIKSTRRWVMTHLGSVLIAATVALGYYAYWIVELIVVRQATDTARVQAELVTHFRNFYTTQLGPIATQSGMRLSHDYKTADSTLPLPATLIIELGHYLSEREGGTQVKLYSQQPFPWRVTERKLDAFQIAALEHFKVDPNSPFVREDVMDGVKVLRFAQADRMLAQCVSCHNNHTQSPRTDWKVGDVRGALEVVLPVSQWFFSGAAVLNQAMIIFLALLIGGQVLIWLSFRRLQRMFASSKELSRSTERANQALTLSESKLSSIFNAVPESVVVIDTDGIIVQCNPATAITFGYSKNELIGTNISRLMNQWDASRHDGYLKAYLETGVRNLFNQPRLVKAKHQDGREITIRLTISETRVADTHLLIGIMQDYTSIEATQAAMADAKDRAEKANRLRGEFLANMSHEIRTPMNGIVGMIDLTLRDDLSAQAKEYLVLARDSSQHLLHVIDDILDFSKIEAGALNLALEPINPRQLIHQTTSSLSALANTKGLYWKLNIEPGMPDCVMLDPVRFRQVLTNLLGNALKFTRVGGVEISASLATEGPRDGADAQPTLQVSVKDTGIGFDPGQKESLFSPFVQADGSITRAFGGSGLGLAISRRLVQLMGGRIECEGLPGQGATFKLSIPIQVCNPEPESPPALVVFEQDTPASIGAQPPSLSQPDSAAAPRKKRLLLVDDHPINLRLLEVLAGKLGYDYVSVTDGEQALEHLRQGQFDLVLMDVMMPIMDGLTAVQRLREREASEGLGHRTCVLFVTAHAMQGDAEKFMAVGADGYLTKPIAPAVLERELKQRLAEVA
jgi:PAS domain S-box-containing protein